MAMDGLKRKREREKKKKKKGKRGRRDGELESRH